MVPTLLKRTDMPNVTKADALRIVKEARALYDDLKGPERAGKIVNYVAWRMEPDGAGTFYKPGGTNWQKRSLDVIIFKDGHTFDCLKDAEGVAEPIWTPTKPTGKGDVKKWRAAYYPGVPQQPPTQPVVTTPLPAAPDTELRRRVAVLEAQVLKMGKDFESLNFRISTLELAEYEVLEASTSRDAFHSHKLSATVTRKKK
jgi:hypothetical protein